MEVMTTRSLPTPQRAVRICVVAAVTAVTCAGLVCAAALAPAPAVLMPFIVAVCVACPMLVAWDLPAAAAALRRRRASIADNARALVELRAALSELPETRHPLGF